MTTKETKAARSDLTNPASDVRLLYMFNSCTCSCIRVAHGGSGNVGTYVIKAKRIKT